MAKRQGVQHQLLLRHQAGQCAGDHEYVVGQYGALVFRLAQLLAMLGPVGKKGITLIRHGDSGSTVDWTDCRALR